MAKSWKMTYQKWPNPGLRQAGIDQDLMKTAICKKHSSPMAKAIVQDFQNHIR
jgi:hypothetical protein